MKSIYDDAAQVALLVAAGKHRETIGGLWDDLGRLQLDFLIAQGLRPEHTLLDVGCGCLRGGVRFAEYLEAGRYAGADSNISLLDAGYDLELRSAGLQHKVRPTDLLHSETFEFQRLGRTFDFAIAQSVFTHLDLNLVRLCLANISRVLKPGARFYATYFEAPADAGPLETVDRGEGIVTKSWGDPFHYRFEDFVFAARGLPLNVERVGAWGHPRGQFMLEFVSTRSNDDDTRALSPEAAKKLPPGAPHYRAFVGPAERYDFMSATQFALLFAMGLKESDDVLDIGCGSLRLGRLLIPFLERGRYCGVEPCRWLISEGLDRELGRDALTLKAPFFSYRDDFNFGDFARRFRFVIAQSIATHTGPDQLDRLLKGAADVLADDGVFLFSYLRDEAAGDVANGWHYPGCVAYRESDIAQRLRDCGLAAAPLPWFHPAASWMAAARDAANLPGPEEAQRLTGRPLTLAPAFG